MRNMIFGSKGILHPNGWMNGECFVQTLKPFHEKSSSLVENKILLIMDNAGCHMNIHVVEYRDCYLDSAYNRQTSAIGCECVWSLQDIFAWPTEWPLSHAPQQAYDSAPVAQSLHLNFRLKPLSPPSFSVVSGRLVSGLSVATSSQMMCL